MMRQPVLHNHPISTIPLPLPCAQLVLCTAAYLTKKFQSRDACTQTLFQQPQSRTSLPTQPPTSPETCVQLPTASCAATPTTLHSSHHRCEALAALPCLALPASTAYLALLRSAQQHRQHPQQHFFLAHRMGGYRTNRTTVVQFYTTFSYFSCAQPLPFLMCNPICRQAFLSKVQRFVLKGV